MGSDDKKECFAKSGPKHISEIDWGKEEYRRCTTACLVKATSILESDRTKGRQDTPDACAPAWWKSFHFCLHRRLICDYVCKCVFCERFEANKPFIYGAIFEYVPPEGAYRHQSSSPPPRFIVSFRGTKLRVPTAIPDIKDDISMTLNMQDTCIRFRKAREQVAELLVENNAWHATGSRSDVWLAGHSLGAAVALDVGRDMMIHKEKNLPTFLFNPPRVSLASLANTRHMSEVARRDWFLMKCMVKGAVACTFMRSREKRMEVLFQRLGHWVPELYMHKDDKICQGYIDDFERQEKMLAECPGILQPLAKLGMKHSFRDMANPCGPTPRARALTTTRRSREYSHIFCRRQGCGRTQQRPEAFVTRTSSSTGGSRTKN